MQLFSILAVLAAAAVVSAQNQTMTVMVGGESSTPGGIFQFIPPSINATNGSVITFEWTGSPGNHSVTQSSFTAPCTPLEGGFDSGWILISETSPLSPPPSWNLVITDDSQPIWFFCKQLQPSPHCNSGMVGGINIQNGLAAFQQAAASAGTPGQGEGGLAGVGASASVGPFVPSGAVLFPSGGATATAPAAGASGGATSGGSASNTASAGASSGSTTAPPSAAVPTVSSDVARILGTVIVGVWVGMAVVF